MRGFWPRSARWYAADARTHKTINDRYIGEKAQNADRTGTGERRGGVDLSTLSRLDPVTGQQVLAHVPRGGQMLSEWIYRAICGLLVVAIFCIAYFGYGYIKQATVEANAAREDCRARGGEEVSIYPTTTVWVCARLQILPWGGSDVR